MIQSVVKLSHNSLYETPNHVFTKIQHDYMKKMFTRDLCAEHSTTKCKEYFTEKEDMFSHEIKDGVNFMNPPYVKKGKSTIKLKLGDEVIKKQVINKYGIDDFIEFACTQHFKHGAEFGLLVFSNISSSRYYQKFVGESPDDKINNHVTIFDYPGRIQFLLNGKVEGVPAFSSKVIIYR